ncbi:MAG TPA: histone deacetylase [Anaerolineales bacterium]|nr:histone deacetylase [Anaerolineales bacterium]
MTTAYAFVPAPEHVYPDHPEAPGRFELLAPRLGSFGAEQLMVHAATKDEIARVHRPALIDSLEAVCKQGSAVIDPAPTFVTTSSFHDALLAAGATLDCTRLVVSGAARNAFSIVRPPGHHAEPDRAMGFCLFNNVAIAACEALQRNEIERVAIVDYDAHHGNGTQAAFVGESRVGYLSTHQWGIYPGTGWYTDAPEAKGRIVNVPLPARSGDQVFQRVAEQIIAPFVRSFRPDLVLVSAGFDAHWNDPITTLGLSTAGFYMLSNQLVELAEELCEGRIVFLLEGGYDAANLANGAAAVFAALTGSTAGQLADDAMPYPEPQSALGQVKKIKEWQGFE